LEPRHHKCVRKTKLAAWVSHPKVKHEHVVTRIRVTVSGRCSKAVTGRMETMSLTKMCGAHVYSIEPISVGILTLSLRGMVLILLKH